MWTGLFVLIPGDGYPFRRRGTANPSGDPDRLRTCGVAYILDEPSIGLHQRDNDKLLKTLEHLRDLGNSVIVVEHDEDTMLAADCIVDIGPGCRGTRRKCGRCGNGSPDHEV